MNTKEWNKDEKSLLLYLESRAVDHSGILDDKHLNTADRDNLKAWAESGFIETGRVASDFLERGTTWAKPSSEAINEAHALRKARAERLWENKTYLTTDEKRALNA